LRLEGISGAVLASLVVMLFLGSWRSTWIVALSIPLSIMAGFAGLYFLGHTINIMTLGGLALVLGRVVDDSIVDVENTVRHMSMGKTAMQAARDSAEEIAVPVFLATVTTVVVFLPLILMEGVGKYLFIPLAISASLAMFASYIVSRTVSPVYLSKFLRPPEEKEAFPRIIFWVALGLAVVGLGGYFLAPRVLLWVLGRRLPVSHETFQVIYQALLVVGIFGGALVALTPVLLFLKWLGPRFQLFFDNMAGVYERILRTGLKWRVLVLVLLVGLAVPSFVGFFQIGQELFPEVDSSEFTIHMRSPGGPRVEETERQVALIEGIIREEVAPEDLEMVLANVGISSRWSAIYTVNNGPHAAFVQVQLRSGFSGRTTPAGEYVEKIRDRLAERFPGHDFFYETGGMIRRILNSGAVAPIEVQFYGRDSVARRALSREIERRVTKLPNVRDTYLPQAMDLPQLRINVDRTKAALLGYTENDILRNVITSLMSSAQLAPNLWIDPQSGNPYVIGVQYPEYLVENLQTLENIPITSERGRPGGRSGSGVDANARLLKELATIEQTNGAVEVFHQDVNRVSQLLVNVSGNDLAGVASDFQKVLDRYLLDTAMVRLPADRKELADDKSFQRQLDTYFKTWQPPLRTRIQKQFGVDPDRLKLAPGMRMEVRGEVTSMRNSFSEMGFSLVLAVLLVYLVMSAQFASWLDPLIMIVAAPLGLVGVTAILWLTGTSLNIQSFMGILMMVGISVSNSVLLVEFANRQRLAGLGSFEAMASAARIRLRPILMTTLATICGLLPMAIHFRPGDEMNLPLARAVIGGLAASTLLTLFVVPVFYVLLKPRGPAHG